jgi:hypothetical protein
LPIEIGTKADTLERLRLVLTHAIVLDQVSFSIGEWQATPTQILEAINEKHWLATLLIVRSSAKSEDNLQTSNAGGYTSILGVKGRDAINQAITKVISSYPVNKNLDDQVLVQPMLTSIARAGVVFTADLDTLMPYYTINYDESGSTESVTSGKEGPQKTYIRYKHSPYPEISPFLAHLIEACREIERLTDNAALDIEFAFDTEGKLYILQVRPIVVIGKMNLNATVDLQVPLHKLYCKIKKLSAKHPNLLGNRPIYGVMPDWNPAEIIGVKPRSLALSLYRELVANNIWAFQRDNYGYRNLRSHPLLVSFLGVPFTDVRVSFNSFIPKKLPENIAEKLADYYLNRLASYPHHHDKVEFEIVHSCYYLNLPDKLQVLLQEGFNENEIKRIEFHLLELTNNIINGLYTKDLNKIEIFFLV